MPKAVSKDIIRMQRQFLWSHDGIKKGIPLVKWEIIQKPIEQGGLGVGDATIRNASLLFKWWWRYTLEEKPLWKRVVDSIHGHESYAWNQKAINTGGPWHDIQQLFKTSEEFQNIASKAFKWKVGSGDKVKFWEDIWVGERCFKEAYPRLYLVSSQKNNFIKEMRMWDGVQWRWTFLWRRMLFEWEKQELEKLDSELMGTYLNENVEDTLWWQLDERGQYSAKTFNSVIWKTRGDNQQHSQVLKQCWQRIAPLRVEVLVWLAIQGKLNTKVRMRRLGILVESATICPMCGKKEESSNHLFISCEFASQLWHEAKYWWKVNFVIPGDLGTNFETWMHTKGVGSEIGKKGWKAIFFVIVEIIWSARNKALFEGKKRDIKMECEWMKLRVSMWLKASCPEITYTPLAMMDNVEMVKYWGIERKRSFVRR